MGMIETQNDAKRLSAIDGATALGQLADDAVLALSHWVENRHLSEGGASALRRLIAWLDAAAESVANPFDSIFTAGTGDAAHALGNFSPDVTDAALGALAAGLNREQEVSVIHDLSAGLAEVLEGRADEDAAESLARTFEAVAKAMLVAADLMLAPAPRTAWTTTSAS